MSLPLHLKSSLSEIERRFDGDVERFSNLDTGQAATIDAPLALELIAQASVAATSQISRVLDIGCGAGNNTIRLLREYGGGFQCDLNDLSEPMLERARERVSAEGATGVATVKGDFRSAELPEGSYDVVLAAAVLHHLRDDADWEAAFSKVYRLLRSGGSFWVSDLVTHEIPEIHALMWKRYGEYLEGLGGAEYRAKVFEYIEQEDSPRPLTYQIDLLRRVGFEQVEVLHKNSCFAVFGARKG